MDHDDEAERKADIPVACAYENASWWTLPRSRRSFFGLSLAAGGIAAALGIVGDTFGQDGRAPLSAFGNIRAADSPSLPPADLAPSVYAVSALSELSQDLFLVQNHPIDPVHDTVVAYSRADGQVEAMLLQGGVITQLYRDPTQPGGWNAYALPYADGVVSMVAGVSGPIVVNGRPQGSAMLKVFYTMKSSPGVLNVAIETTSPSGGGQPHFALSTAPWSTNTAFGQRLQLSVNHDESLLVSALVPAVSATGAQLWYWTDGVTSAFESAPSAASTGSLTGFGFFPVVNPGSWGAVVGQDQTGSGVPTIYLWLPGSGIPASRKPVVGTYAAVLNPGSHTNVAVRDLSAAYNAVPAPPTPNALITGVASLNPLGSRLLPSALVWVATALPGENPTGIGLWTLSNDNDHKTWHWTEMSLPGGLNAAVPPPLATAMRPSTDPSGDGVAATRLLDTFVLVDDTASVVRQAATGDGDADVIAPKYTPYLPFQSDVAMVVSQASTSTGNELLYVQKSTGLLVSLERDPQSGTWSDHLVHLPAGELQQTDTYRVTLTLADQWNAVRPNTALTVTATTPALANVNDQVVTLGSDPYSFTTDAQGLAQIAILADGLSAPTLTIAGEVLGSATVRVDPSSSVNNYFTGSSSLNYLDSMSVSTLQGARDDSGAVLVPGASNTSDAQDAITNMNSAATWGAAGAVGIASSTVGATGGVGGTITASTVSDIDQWTHDVLHAIKTGATKVTTIARDTASKAFTITCDLTGWVGKAIRIVVKTIEDAAHVLVAVLRKLLAEILKIIKWLAAEVIELLKDSWALAQQYQVWFGECTNLVATTLTSGKATAEQWLAQKRSWLESSFHDVVRTFDKSATIGGSSASRVSTSQDTGGLLGAGTTGGSTRAHHSSHGTWLICKVLNLIGGSTNVPTDKNLSAAMSEFVTAAADEALAFFDVYRGFWKFLADSIRHPSDISDLLYRDILEQLENLLDTTLNFIQKLLDVMFELLSAAIGSVAAALSAASLDALGLLGKLLELIGIKGPSMLDVITLVFAFPATLEYKLAHGGKGRPFAGLSAQSAPAATVEDVETTDLELCASSALGMWALLDTMSATITAASGGKETPPAFFGNVDIAAPFVVGALTTPTTGADGRPYHSWPISASYSDRLTFLSWFLGMLPGATALIGGISAKEAKKNKKNDEMETPVAVMTCVIGVISIVTGCVGNHLSSHEQDVVYFEDVLDNIAYVAAPLLIGDVVEASEGTTAVAAIALTFICGETGAALPLVES